MMIERVQAKMLTEMLEVFPVVAVVGPRQVGKSTLVQKPEIAGGRVYRSLDDLAVLGLAQRDPRSLVTDADRVTLDEVQRAPELLLAIKREVDTARRPGRFIVTGSADLDFTANLASVLAGRVGVLFLPPISWREQQGRLSRAAFCDWVKARSLGQIEETLPGGSVDAFDADAVMVGGFPLALTAETAGQRRMWFESFRYTYLERDVRQVSEIGHLADFARLLEVAAARTAQTVNQAMLARDVGLSPATAGRYLSLLEATYQIVRRPPYFSNIGKRLVKSPKLYWLDTGMAAHLLGLKTWQDAVAEHFAGSLFETFVMNEIDGLLRVFDPQARLYHLRTHDGLEVDGIACSGQRILPVEIKASFTVRTDDARALVRYMEREKRASLGLVLYMGADVLRLGDRVIALPATALLQ